LDSVDADADAHTLLASLSAEHVHAMLPLLGPARLRRSILACFCAK
jgi:hypothetical protein